MAEIGTVNSGFSADRGNGEKEPVRLSSLKALPFFFPIAIFPFVVAAATYGGWWLTGPFVFLLLVDQLDTSLGTDIENVNPNQSDNRLFWFSMAVWAWVAVYFVTFIYAFRQVFVVDELAIWESVLVVLALGAVARMALNAGHDMIHRRTKLERRIGEFLMASVSFPQEVTEHVYVHHTFIGTPKDAVSAPKGQSFWQYLPRSVGRSYIDTWRVERNRLHKRRLPTWHYSNPIWRYIIETAIWYAFAYWVGGGLGLLAFASISAMGVFQLRMVDYMQHYGLQRIRRSNGRYEQVMPRHSWSIAYKLSNWFYYNAQRHADHHIFATRPYPLLKYSSPEQAPQLPGSYSAMGNLVFFPKRWFQKMDPLVDEWRKHFYPEVDNWSVYESAAYHARPDAYGEIEKIHKTSPRLADIIEHAPNLLDQLQSREFTDVNLSQALGSDPELEILARRGLARVYWTYEMNIEEIKARISELPAQGIKESIINIREWSNDKAFQVYMHVILGNLTPSEAGVAVSNLAEATIHSSLSVVYRHYSLRRADGGIMAALLGALGSEEAIIGGEMDVLFVYEGESDNTADGLIEHFQEALRVLASENLLIGRFLSNRKPWKVRLLDSTSLGKLVEESTDSLMNVVPARRIFLAGDMGIGKRFDKAAYEIISDDRVRETEISRLKKMTMSPEEPDFVNFMHVCGGVQDIKRAVHFLQLSHSGIPEILAYSKLSVLQTGASHGLIAADTAEHLKSAILLWRNLHGSLSLISNGNRSIEDTAMSSRSMIAKACGNEDFNTLSKIVRDTAKIASKDIETMLA
ncbi:MAG: hypothetical protein F4X92_07625 [Gammaproteobacteria bacterium]|nr:hypothetical protein [Gammaproteobacteria bacterium]